MSKPNVAFKLERFTVPIERILPIRLIKDPEKNIRRYVEIVSSIRETGLIEPLMVYPQQGGTDNFLLTDGHLRLFACRELGMKEVECIVSLDDESYTYNAKVNRLAPIQERRMILKAIDSGVPIDRIAKALNMDLREIRAKLNVTAGLCPEAVDLLKEKQISPHTLGLLRKVTPGRQIEIVELMVSANNYTHIYTEALLSECAFPVKSKPNPRSVFQQACILLLPWELRELSIQRVLRWQESFLAMKYRRIGSGAVIIPAGIAGNQIHDDRLLQGGMRVFFEIRIGEE